MPEYRRFIAYFYEYIDGRKQKNAGFAKVELRNEIWRILLRLNLDTCAKQPMQAYGFVRKSGYLLKLPLGAAQPNRELTGEWTFRAGTPVGESGYGLEDLAGIWVEGGDGRRFGTVWDDEGIDPGRFVQELPEGESGEKSGLLNPPEKKTEAEAGWLDVSGGESGESIEPPNQQGEAPGDGAEELEPPGGESEMDSEVPEVRETTANEESGILEAGEMTANEESGISEAGETTSDGEPKISGVRDLRAGDVLESISIETERLNQTKEMTQASVQELSDQTGLPESSGEQTQREERGVMEELFRKRTRFQPFSDTELENCVMIMPCDIVRLQQDGWQTGRNSFLQHGFYQYRHLLLGMERGGAYVLGVPGIRNPQEAYMAKMFGFDRFKASEGRSCSQEFGYWCRELRRCK